MFTCDAIKRRRETRALIRKCECWLKASFKDNNSVPLRYLASLSLFPPQLEKQVKLLVRNRGCIRWEINLLHRHCYEIAGSTIEFGAFGSSFGG